MESQKPIIICGPTASGKSALAIQLAQKIGAVIINADSQQVFREIPILSAQPSVEEKELVPHYLFGDINGNEDFNVAIWLDEVNSELPKHPRSIIVGGNGMYLNALLNGLAEIPNIPTHIREKVRVMDRPQLAAQLGAQADGNTSRMRRNLEVKLATGKYISEFHSEQEHACKSEDFNILNVNVSRETIYDNINRRFEFMVDNGAIEEVKNLLAKSYSPTLPIMKAVGVSEIAAYLAGDVSRETMVDKAQQRSRNYAKRQLTWFRNQMPAHKIDVASFEQAINLFK